MAQEEALSILQYVGLSLPFIALYLRILMEVHNYKEVIKDNDRIYPTSDIEERIPNSVGGVVLSKGPNKWDFRIGILSVIPILFSAIVLILGFLVTLPLYLEISIFS